MLWVIERWTRTSDGAEEEEEDASCLGIVARGRG
jgi:hypothetical protein